MNEKLIQRGLIMDRFPRSIVCPNYTPANWWECDLIEITRAGYFVEYEIKLTLSDFKADAEKFRTRIVDRFTRNVRRVDEKKHEFLSDGSEHGPNRFFYVTPEHLPVDVPSWAGHIVMRQSGKRLFESTVKKAPKLHGEKFSKDRMEHLRGVFYYRFHRLLIKSS